MAFKITDKCIKCGACAAACPVQCITDEFNQCSDIFQIWDIF